MNNPIALNRLAQFIACQSTANRQTFRQRFDLASSGRATVRCGDEDAFSAGFKLPANLVMTNRQLPGPARQAK